jgi:hypothetical protein
MSRASSWAWRWAKPAMEDHASEASPQEIKRAVLALAEGRPYLWDQPDALHDRMPARDVLIFFREALDAHAPAAAAALRAAEHGYDDDDMDDLPRPSTAAAEQWRDAPSSRRRARELKTDQPPSHKPRGRPPPAVPAPRSSDRIRQAAAAPPRKVWHAPLIVHAATKRRGQAK